MPYRIRPNVLEMKKYPPGKPKAEAERELGISDVIKLASNENPLGPSPLAVEAVKKAAETMQLYPDANGFELCQAIAKRFDVPEDWIVMGNGSDELILNLGLVLLGSPEDEVVVGDPSFIRYDAAAKLAPCKLIKVPLDGDARHDLTAMARQVTANTKIVFIANPNNPTGTIVRQSELESFLNDLPSGVLTVLDEAYFEFAQHVPDYPNGLQLLKDGRSVASLRTFSKTYGLAGIRIGYGFFQPELAEAINKVRMPFNVNSLAQAAAIAALQDESHIRRTTENNRKGVERISQALRELGFKVFESYGNFVYADLGHDAQPVFQALLRQGIIVRPGATFGTPNCIRVSVGTEEEVARFVEGIRSVMREPATA